MGTSTRTTVSSTTFTHTATQLAGAVTSSLSELLLAVGIGVDKVTRLLQYEDDLAWWIERGELGEIVIELLPPGGGRQRGWTVSIDYSAFDPAGSFRDHLSRLRRRLHLEPEAAGGTDWAITVRPRPGRSLSDRPGWTTRTTALAQGGPGHRHGTVASGPGASAVLRSYRLES